MDLDTWVWSYIHPVRVDGGLRFNANSSVEHFNIVSDWTDKYAWIRTSRIDDIDTIKIEFFAKLEPVVFLISFYSESINEYLWMICFLSYLEILMNKYYLFQYLNVEINDKIPSIDLNTSGCSPVELCLSQYVQE